MGRIRKHKLSWKQSQSSLVVSYRLYFSIKNPVSYDSHFINLENNTEVYLPDILLDITPSGAYVYLGVSAVDKVGNESDIISLPECVHFEAPPAPVQINLETLDSYKIIEPKEENHNQVQDSQRLNTSQSDQKFQLTPTDPKPMVITTTGEINEDFNF